jgi:transcriptional regulator with XRE-family HTH domain
MKHWTQNTADFTYNISMDFFTQLEDRMQESGISRKELSDKLHVTPSAVSQTLNNPPENPFVDTIVGYARELGLKVAIVVYDDGDPDNDKGPIYSGVFEKAWQAQGCPRDLSPFVVDAPVQRKALLLMPGSSNTPLVGHEGIVNSLVVDDDAPVAQRKLPRHETGSSQFAGETYAQAAAGK